MAANFKQSLTDEEKAKLECMLSALEPFLALRSTMPLQYVKAFILSCLYEGEGVTELGNKSGVSQSVMSRHLLDIGDRNRHMEEGFGLVTQRSDPMELRKHQVLLTPKGKATAHQVIRSLSKGKA